MSWNLVQFTPGTISGSDSATIGTAIPLPVGAFPNPVTIGNVVIVFVWTDGNASRASVNDSERNTYLRLAFQRDTTATPSHGWVGIFGSIITTNPTSGNLNPQVVVGGNCGNMAICAAEFSGGTLDIDGISSALGNSNTPAPGSITTTVADDLILTVEMNGTTFYLNSTPTGFTDIGINSASAPIGNGGYQIATGIVTNSNPQWLVNGNENWIAAQVALKPI